MPESKADAEARAKKEGFPPSSVVEGEKGWYIIPHGVTEDKAKRAYVYCRDGGGKAETCAAVAHDLQNSAIENSGMTIKVLGQDDERNYNVVIEMMNNQANRKNDTELWRYHNLAECGKTFAGMPILCAFPNGKLGDGHNSTKKINPRTGNEYNSFIGPNDEHPMGYHSENPNDFWVETKDGIETLYGKGKIWWYYSQELVEAIHSGEFQPNVSVEALSLNEEFTMDGQQKTTDIYAFKGYGTTILGRGVSPVVPTANLKELAAFVENDFTDLKLYVASLTTETNNNEGVEEKMIKIITDTLDPIKRNELEKQFLDYHVLGFADEAKDILLMSKESANFFVYRVNTDDEGKINSKRFEHKSLSVNATLIDGEEPVCMELWLNSILELATKNLETVKNSQEALKTEIESERNLRLAAEQKITELEDAEQERRKETAKKVLENEIERNKKKVKGNEQYPEVPDEKIQNIAKSIEAGIYNSCVDENGRWNGDKMVKKEYSYAFGEASESFFENHTPEIMHHNWDSVIKNAKSENISDGLYD